MAGRIQTKFPDFGHNPTKFSPQELKGTHHKKDAILRNAFTSWSPRVPFSLSLSLALSLSLSLSLSVRSQNQGLATAGKMERRGEVLSHRPEIVVAPGEGGAFSCGARGYLPPTPRSWKQRNQRKSSFARTPSSTHTFTSITSDNRASVDTLF